MVSTWVLYTYWAYTIQYLCEEFCSRARLPKKYATLTEYFIYIFNVWFQKLNLGRIFLLLFILNFRFNRPNLAQLSANIWSEKIHSNLKKWEKGRFTRKQINAQFRLWSFKLYISVPRICYKTTCAYKSCTLVFSSKHS